MKPALKPSIKVIQCYFLNFWLGLALIAVFLTSVATVSGANGSTYEDQLASAKQLYFSGEIEQAKALFEALSTQGDAEAYYYLALIARSQNKPFSEIINKLEVAANSGDSSAMFELGRIYEMGQGVDKDLLIALDWYRRAEQESFATSPPVIFFENQNGTDSELSQTDMLNRLIEDGSSDDGETQFKVAKSYDFNLHGIQSGADAIKWYTKAAENNHQYSQLLMGYFLCRGIYVAPDKKLANEWFEKSGREVACKN
ncbi:hypothetical protein OLMES_0398 [Oleiphilus messinensis]|uniref:Sel1 repeat family protein n=1 Tax=Oleiphilus messinensis TaxID=141451 RepID=A0A1Y0I213_9GAMM|nr:tetratricopeptide repeat protein [Oleiphilus messinensis]ARU54502.1 hypothetical protein OLMES_0398 [Oleiphilus messinensis]